VQDEVAAAIANTLHAKLSPKPAEQPRHIPKLPAYEAYLKARYYQWKFTPEAPAKAKECYEQAIALDPEFALAHVGYADYVLFQTLFGNLTSSQAVPVARAGAQRALELDPHLPEAYGILGNIACSFDFDWKESDRLYKLAMARDPVPALVRVWYGMSYLARVGRAQEAVAECERGLQEDPLNITFRVCLANCLMWAERYADAEREVRQALEIDPQFIPAYGVLAGLLAARGMLAEAVSCAERGLPWTGSLIAGLRKRLGDTAGAEELMRNAPLVDAYGGPIVRAIFHLYCGEMDAAADWMEKAIAQRHPGAWMMLAGPLAREIRSGPRWPKLAKMLNLPEMV
jgi:serine/threonine-protein kinase